MTDALALGLLDRAWLTAVDVCVCVLVVGTLKGYDQLMNLVLDDVKETLRGMFRIHPSSLSFLSSCNIPIEFVPLMLTFEMVVDDAGNESSRSLGLIVARGTLLVLISPVDGSEEIANPFNQQEE